MKRFLLYFIFLSLCFSQSKVFIQDKEITIQDNEVIIEVLGMVCSMCAYGIEQGFSEIDFVDKTKFKNGVFVELDSQFVQIGLKESSNVNPETILTVIEEAGYQLNTLFIFQEKNLTKFRIDKVGILQPVALIKSPSSTS